ncbi:hypothetical protein FA13DRAFT_1527707 [Coprinellus micaceus]|uniref:Uncharacterized protein n=1 Tax=Coprinellus micaceus TaxID=71717 RepID=A0A4Y7SJD8_COPMI|nr:hypothetical protein FA13DRAFT_1527707 [Coprinellus micaceus]
MVRTTRNSQRAAAHAVPPSASRPASPYNFNTNPVPFPSLDALNELEDEHPNQIKPSEQQYRELPTTGRRRSTRQALKAIPNAPAAPPVAVTTNSNKDPSPPPVRRPPTGSRAKRHVLGDLMDPPPPAPTPSVASEEPADENDENAIPYWRWPHSPRPLQCQAWEYRAQRRTQSVLGEPVAPSSSDTAPTTHRMGGGRVLPGERVGYR